MTATSVPLVVRRWIRQTPEAIFEAFSNAEALSKWFTPSVEVTVDVLSFDFRVGGGFELCYTMPDRRRAVVVGVYEEIARPNQIVTSWVWQAPDPLAGIPMRVAFEFVEKPGGTEVWVNHEGIPTDAACTVHEGGWDASLGNLAVYLDGVMSESRSRDAI